MKINLYVTDMDIERIHALQALLKNKGIVYLDNRGNDSVSGLFRALVAEKLEDIRRKDFDPDAPYPEDDPWDEMGFPAPRS